MFTNTEDLYEILAHCLIGRINVQEYRFASSGGRESRKLLGQVAGPPTTAVEVVFNHLEVKMEAANDLYRLDTIGPWKGDQSNDHASI